MLTREESIKKILEEHSDCSTCEIMALTGLKSTTINYWKRRLGMQTKTFPVKRKTKRQPKQIKAIADPTIWNNKEWFYQRYEVDGLGVPTIAKMIGRSKTLVLMKLQKHGIRTRPIRIAMASKNPCCSKKWLMENYAEKDEYSEWCKENRMTPGDGGKGYNLRECAAIACVSRYTICLWLASHGMVVRSHGEAISGERNPFYGKRHTEETINKIRALNATPKPCRQKSTKISTAIPIS